MARNQDGFSVVEGLIVSAIVVILLLAGWLVYSRTRPAPVNAALKTTHSTVKQAAPKSTASTKTATRAATGNKAGTQASPVQAQKLQDCILTELNVSVGSPHETAGSIYTDITFTNTFTQSCIMNGFPTVSLADSKGNDLGKPADNNGSSNGPVTLASHQSATATVSVPNPGMLSPGACTAPASYILINAPNDGRYSQLDYHEAYCPGFAVTAMKSGS